MGQSLMKFAPGLLSNPIYKVLASASQAADEWRGLFSVLNNEIGEITTEEDRSEAHKEKEIGAIIEGCYDKYFADQGKEWKFTDFYRAISQIVEEINEKLGNTQFRVPSKDVLDKAFKNHHKGKGKNLKKEEFNMILREILMNTGFTGFGSKDVFFYIFGIPAAALFIKNGVAPRALPNDIFIPGVTSATVFLLSKLNKL